MKNIILQHWSGVMNELGERSSANISKYAASCGADYKLLRGDVLNSSFTAPIQKLFMLNEAFDDYDIVVMIDMDMFVRKGMNKNIFTDEVGIGKHSEVQSRLEKKIIQQYPTLCKHGYPYWGGAIYRLPKILRVKMRKYLNMNDFVVFNKAYHYEDEGIMHALAVRADIKTDSGSYMKNNLWECGNFEKNVGECYMIHIRTKITPTGPKQDKILNYRDMVSRGLIEE